MGKYDTRIELPKTLYKLIENDVARLHMELELSIPVRPIEVANKLGFIVKRFSEIATEENNMMMEWRVGLDGKRRDGLSYYFPESKTFIIWVNDIDTFYEEHDDFTIMHEIGHIRMGHKEDSQLAEQVANYYAAYALVPSILPKMYNCLSYMELKEKFEVSIDSAFYSWNRCINRELYGGSIKPYEKDLRDYYTKVIKGGDAYD